MGVHGHVATVGSASHVHTNGHNGISRFFGEAMGTGRLCADTRILNRSRPATARRLSSFSSRFPSSRAGTVPSSGKFLQPTTMSPCEHHSNVNLQSHP